MAYKSGQRKQIGAVPLGYQKQGHTDFGEDGIQRTKIDSIVITKGSIRLFIVIHNITRRIFDRVHRDITTRNQMIASVS